MNEAKEEQPESFSMLQAKTSVKKGLGFCSLWGLLLFSYSWLQAGIEEINGIKHHREAEQKVHVSLNWNKTFRRAASAVSSTVPWLKQCARQQHLLKDIKEKILLILKQSDLGKGEQTQEVLDRINSDFCGDLKGGERGCKDRFSDK